MSCNTKQSPFPFLSLPPELRDQIYTALLSAQHSIDIFRYQKRFTCTKSSDSNDENPEGVHIPVSILRICKQIHAEATPVLYSSNKLVFTFPSVLTGFLEGTRAARWMMDVAINHPGNRVEILGSLKVLEMGVVRLESLELGGAIGKLFTAEEITAELVELVRKMGEVNGDMNVEKTLSRAVFVSDAGDHTRALSQLAERHRMAYEEEVKKLLRGELEDKD